MSEKANSPFPCIALWSDTGTQDKLSQLVERAFEETDVFILDTSNVLAEFLEFIGVPNDEFDRMHTTLFRVADSIVSNVWNRNIMKEMFELWGKKEAGRFVVIGFDGEDDCSRFCSACGCPIAYVNLNTETVDNFKSKFFKSLEEFYV